MVEAGWPHNDWEHLDLDEARLQSIMADNGKHAKLATDYRGIVFPWSKVQRPGYQPRHEFSLRIGAVLYDGVTEGFAMVVPKGGPFGERQPVVVGPHTFHGQPCGGYGCAGWAPYCDECEEVIQAEHDERWSEYYSQIGPLNRYERYGEDDAWS